MGFNDRGFCLHHTKSSVISCTFFCKRLGSFVTGKLVTHDPEPGEMIENGTFSESVANQVR